MKVLFRLLLLPLLAASPAGCASDGEACVAGESYCDDDGRAHTCTEHQERDDETVWTIVPCGEDGRGPVCVEASYGAACAASDAPVAACAGLPAYAHACDGADEVICHGGYAVLRESCASCSADIDDPDGVRCDGGLYAGCDDDDACAADLTCEPAPDLGDSTTWCTRGCACPDGICDECATTTGPASCEAGQCRL